MTTTSPSSASSNVATPAVNTSQNLITINAVAQLPLRLTSLNYFSWRAQFNALSYGLDLFVYLDGTHHLRPLFTTLIDRFATNPSYIHWRCQEQLLLQAILPSINDGVIPLISSASSNRDALDHLSRLYAKQSNQHIIHLKDKLSTLTRGYSSVTEFFCGY